jgi:hypothetical protein
MKQTGKGKVSGIFTLTNHRVNSRIFKMTSEEQIENLLPQSDKLGHRFIPKNNFLFLGIFFLNTYH